MKPFDRIVTAIDKEVHNLSNEEYLDLLDELIADLEVREMAAKEEQRKQ